MITGETLGSATAQAPIARLSPFPRLRNGSGCLCGPWPLVACIILVPQSALPKTLEPQLLCRASEFHPLVSITIPQLTNHIPCTPPLRTVSRVPSLDPNKTRTEHDMTYLVYSVCLQRTRRHAMRNFRLPIVHENNIRLGPTCLLGGPTVSYTSSSCLVSSAVFRWSSSASRLLPLNMLIPSPGSGPV